MIDVITLANQIAENHKCDYNLICYFGRALAKRIKTSNGYLPREKNIFRPYETFDASLHKEEFLQPDANQN